MTKAGFKNSDGWMPKIQRREPLTSWPNSSAATISAIDTMKTMSAARRTCRGDRKDVSSSTAMVGISASRLPVDEMEGRQAEPLGDRRAACHGQHEAEDDQRADGGEQPAVDRPPPIGQSRTFRARRHCFKSPTTSNEMDFVAFWLTFSTCNESFRKIAEAVAALLEIGELVEGGAGRRQQHDGVGDRARGGVAQRPSGRRLRAFRRRRPGRRRQSSRRRLRSPRRSDRP